MMNTMYDSKSIFRRTMFALVGVLVVWGIYLAAVHCGVGFDWASSGQFGDTFGGLNALFTGWAFVVVVATLFQQSRQIEEARSDIKEQRLIQEKTEKLLLKQVEALWDTAQIQALTSRIEAYHVQIHGVQESELKLRLVKERHELIGQLDKFLRPHGDPAGTGRR